MAWRLNAKYAARAEFRDALLASAWHASMSAACQWSKG
eukprot:CAMPEP_0115682142 /NCGR_PEP_ID=MMETSP0272-20121206/57695_1 /TAXON_ID=71861 /ORGANISM="Scrippsiella trochoidea, Strain CCMP3099" /LENGTH=37 /DNA_ID= /DNA_START= /DNA_END= /DNA_ORIENTATION=